MAVGTCSECGQEKELGSRTICEACRKRIQRANKKDPTPATSPDPAPIPIKDGHLVVENVPQYKLKLTPVDLEYQEYYEGETGKSVVFQEKPATRKCVICKKEFKTHLEALRFCSMDCRQYFTTGDGVLSSKP